MGICFDDYPCGTRPCNPHKSCCDECNKRHLVEQCDIQFIGAHKHVAFNKEAFCEYRACDGGCPCATTHYFFIGTVCKCGCGKLKYEETGVYYLKNINETYFLYSQKDNKKITKNHWCSDGKPGNWTTIFMICADRNHRGPP